jgi:regulator of sirC expression with transglutaminase-like and TPR domain
MDDALAAFAEIARLPDEAIDLDEAALILAQSEYPALDRAHYLLRLSDLADGALPHVDFDAGPYAIVNRLSEYLFDEQAFRGNPDEYYDPRNSFLNEVLDRKVGIPITLSVLYIEVGRRLGLQFRGANMPGHFVVLYEADGERLVVDPFHRGAILEPADCERLMSQATGQDIAFDPSYLEPASTRQVLERMLNNLKVVYMNAQDYPRALAAVERLVLLTPSDARQVRLRNALRSTVG